MKRYTTERFRIDIFADETFTGNPPDNVYLYDFVYSDKSDYKLSSIFGIRTFQYDHLIKSTVIGSSGGSTGIHAKSTIIENDRLLVCCSDSVFCLSIPDLSLLWRTKADEVTCFAIYKYKDSYIIHGELEISRLDKDGKILWQQSGADIFTTLDGNPDLVINDDYILATDFENRKYKFDFDGKIIS
ncbi:hypothetical protein [Sphingobacterium hungaricum]|uniref:PQQ-like domain-containing protein n=1 Tax=Sphingobacterium hungaricum TaxID=2082723 RepID=A0A928V1A0_9SPHI|nr:hypothetical protein [Sphingobacterium hungaricum]MBE8715265.1 hypothetical protein [Sphingobacterium hungaricum]